MKGLTLWQSWASLVSIGAKQIETRSWQTDYRGPIAIHAAARWTREQSRLAREDSLRAALTAAGVTLPKPGGFVGTNTFPLGFAVAVATLAACWPTVVYRGRPALCSSGVSWLLTDEEISYGDYSPGRWGWILHDVRPLKPPVSCAGARGLWTVSPELEARVLAARVDSPGIAGEEVDS